MGKLISKTANQFGLVLLALPFLVLLPWIGDFPYRSAGAQFSDIAITHYPNAMFLLHSLQEYHQIPLWSPSILSGYPFFANPLSGLFYPPGWLALLFPLPFGFNLLLALHFIWGGLGMYQLLKIEGISKWSAVFGGLGFAMLPKVFAHYGAGHMTLLYAIAWTPWLLYCQVRRAKTDTHPGKDVIMGGIVLGMIFLADVRWSMYAGVLCAAYTLSHRHKLPLRKMLLFLFGQVAIAFLLAAPLALPLIEYSQRSTRASMGIGQVGAYSLPLANLAGLLYPDFHGNHEWVLYAGGISLALAVLGVASRPARSGIKFWGVVLTLSLVFSLGEALPGFSWLTRLPGFDLLRVPSRSLFLAGMGLVALAAYGCETIINPPEKPLRRSVNLALTGLLALTLSLGIGLAIQSDRSSWNIIWGMASTLLGVAWVLLGLNKPLSRQLWLIGLFFLAILDWVGVARLSFVPRSAEVVLGEGSQVAEYLASQSGEFRIYSPSYSLPQQTAILYNLQLADGVDPLQLQIYADYMEVASGVPPQGYQVTIPAYATGDPDQDNRAYLPDLDALGKLNVAYLVAAYELQVDGLTLVDKVGETYIYQNPALRPRAWVQPSSSTFGMNLIAVINSSWSPNRIEITALGPGMLVLSEIAYPGWLARIDGKYQPVLTQENIFRGVMLSPGTHRVVFNYVPISLFVGLILFLVGFVTCSILYYLIGQNTGKGSSYNGAES